MQKISVLSISIICIGKQNNYLKDHQLKSSMDHKMTLLIFLYSSFFFLGFSFFHDFFFIDSM